MQRDDDAVSGPLAGIRVLDFTRMIVGPVATMLLADLGADVIKVEPSRGDALRWMQDDDDPERSAFFISTNRNKRDVVLDLDDPAAEAVVHALVREADVVVHNFMPQLERRWRLGFDELRAHRADLVYCGIGAWGGPGAQWSERPGTDVLFQAASGLMSVTGERDGRRMRAGAPIIDVTTGVTAAFAILAALRHRDITGEAVQVGTSLYEQALFMQSPLLAWTQQRGMNPPRLGNQSPMALILELACEGGDLVVSLPTEKMWKRLCEAIGAEELSAAPEYSTAKKRLEHQSEIASEVTRLTRERSKQELASLLGAAGVPFAPVNDYREALDSVRDVTGCELVAIEGEEYGRLDVVANPVRSSAWSSDVRLPAPRLGAHTAEVLKRPEAWGLTGRTKRRSDAD